MENIKKNPRFYGLSTLYIPNDSFAESVFYYQKVDIDHKYKVLEAKSNKKHGEIITTCTLRTPPDQAMLNQFDRAVLSAVMSLYEAGNNYITAPMICRTLHGKTSALKGGYTPHPFLVMSVNNSVNKMADTTIDCDMKYASEMIKYDLKETKIHGRFLPVEIVSGKLGYDYYVIQDTAPIYRIAKAKGQVLTCELSLLNYIRHATPTLISIEQYILQRVLESTKHRRNMSPSVTFDDIFTKCGVFGNIHSIDEKETLYRKITRFMMHLKTCGIINTFEIMKERRTIFRSISFERPLGI